MSCPVFMARRLAAPSPVGHAELAARSAPRSWQATTVLTRERDACGDVTPHARGARG